MMIQISQIQFFELVRQKGLMKPLGFKSAKSINHFKSAIRIFIYPSYLLNS